MPGAGPQLVVTDKAIFHFDAESGEMVLASVHPGVIAETVQAEVSWPLKIAPDLKTTEPPTAEELRLILGDPAFSPNEFRRLYRVPGLDESLHAGASLLALQQVLLALETDR